MSSDRDKRPERLGVAHACNRRIVFPEKTDMNETPLIKSWPNSIGNRQNRPLDDEEKTVKFVPSGRRQDACFCKRYYDIRILLRSYGDNEFFCVHSPM